MSTDGKPKTKEVLELAQKQRHEVLLEKVKKGKALSPSEFNELKKFEGSADAPPGVVDTQEQVARVFSVSHRTVQNWVKDGMPITPERRYDLSAIFAWRADRQGGEEGAPEKSQKILQETEYKQYKTLILKIEYQKLIGSLIPREDVEQERIQRILTVKRALLALPARLAPQVIGQDVKKAEEIIRKRVEAIIEDFSRGGAGLEAPQEAA